MNTPAFPVNERSCRGQVLGKVRQNHGPCSQEAPSPVGRTRWMAVKRPGRGGRHPTMVTDHPCVPAPSSGIDHLTSSLWQRHEAPRGRAARPRPGGRGGGSCVRGVLGAHRGCHVQKPPQEERGHHSWPAGKGPLWPCHVGFAGGIGKPRKGEGHDEGWLHRVNAWRCDR